MTYWKANDSDDDPVWEANAREIAPEFCVRQLESHHLLAEFDGMVRR